MDIKVLVPLAQGSEELEAVTIINLFRRAGVQVKIAGENEIITCARGVKIIPDVLLDSIDTDLEFDSIVIPGGVQGVENLMKYEILGKMLQRQKEESKLISAICAAPLVLDHFSRLERDAEITSHPSVKEQLLKYKWQDKTVVEQDNIITSKGAGTAIEFSLTLLSRLCGDDTADKIAEEIIYR